jgi:O-antigen/teichoic acid export membrane protein
MIAKFISLSSSELFLRASKFLFFISIANFYDESIMYEYGFLTSLFSIIFVFSDLGYQTYVFKELSSKITFTTYIQYSKLAIFRILFFIFSSLLVLLYLLYSDKELFVYIFIIFLADSIFAMDFSFYRASQNSKKESILKFSISSIYILVSILSIYKINSQIFFAIFSLSYLIFAIYSAKYLKSKIIYLFFKNFNIKTYLLISKSSFYIFLGGLFTVAYLRIDILMLDFLSNSSNVAIYTVSSRVLELSLIFPATISILIFPILIKKKYINIKKDLYIQFIIGLFVMFFFLFASPIIIDIFFRHFINSINILKILLFSIPFMLVNGYIFTLFIAKNKSKYYTLVTILMLILNISLNYIFIPLYSYEVAAYTTLLTEILGSIICILILTSVSIENWHIDK